MTVWIKNRRCFTISFLFLISSYRTEDWTIGFAKLANALYLKDADQDGYLTGMPLIMIA